MNLLDNSNVRFGSLLSVVSIVAAGVWWGAGTLNSMRSDVTDTRREMSEARREVKELKENGLTVAQAAEAALRMAIENPGLRVPDPRDPNKIIVVQSRQPGSGINDLRP